VTKRLNIESCGFHHNAAECLKSSLAKFGNEVRKGPLDRGWEFFHLRHSISEMERDKA